MSQLRKDISKRIREKHRMWLKDSINLYEMAGLSQAEAAYDILYALIIALISGCRANNISQERALELLDEWIEKFAEEERRG
jgi:hypothetical protein